MEEFPTIPRKMHLWTIFLGILAFAVVSHCDDGPGPGFFLKVTKNVPRLGRRSDREYESFFTKNSKTIPRMGRRGEDGTSQLKAWLNEDTNSALPITKRMMMNSAAAAAATERELSVVQPVNSNTLIEMLNKDAIPNESVKFVHWKDFDRALQLDTDLYAKVISLGRRPDQRLKEDLGFSTYVPISFYSPSSRNRIGGGIYDNGKELYTHNYDRDMLEYNELK